MRKRRKWQGNVLGWVLKIQKSIKTDEILKVSSRFFKIKFEIISTPWNIITLLAYYCSNVSFHFVYKLFIWNFPYLSRLVHFRIAWMLSDMDILHISVMMNFSFAFFDGRKLNIEKQRRKNLNYICSRERKKGRDGENLWMMRRWNIMVEYLDKIFSMSLNDEIRRNWDFLQRERLNLFCCK